MYSTKHWISIIVGFVLILLGLLPLLSKLGIIPLSFDTWVGKLVSVFAYIIAFAGIYLIIDSFHEIAGVGHGLGWFTLVFGFVVLALGIIQILFKFGVLPFKLPTFPEEFYYALFMFQGILLFIAGFLD